MLHLKSWSLGIFKFSYIQLFMLATLNFIVA